MKNEGSTPEVTGKTIIETLKLLIPFLRKPIESVIISFFLNMGRTLIVGLLTKPWWESVVIGIIEKHLGANINSLSNTIGGLLLGLALLSWTIAIVFYWKTVYSKRNPQPKDISIYQHSIENIVDKNPVSEDEELYEIDLRFELKDKSKYGIIKAIEKQFDKTMAIQETIKREKHLSMNYYGLASIPFTMLLGYNISDKYKVVFNEWDNDQKNWICLADGDDYPKIVVGSKNSIERNTDAGELIIRVNFTTRVEDEHIENLCLDVLNVIDFGVKNPARGVIKSHSQLVDYQNKFRELLDSINANYLNVSKIHVFMSAQPSIVFTLGSKISERVDAEIVIYEHARQNEIRYPWGLKLVKDYKKTEDIVVETTKGELHVRHE